MMYRKKPVEVEAVQWFRHGDHPAVKRASPSPFLSHILEQRVPIEHLGVITTLEGNLYVRPGDWIIKGIQGEYYPCNPDVFQATYEAA